MRVNEWAFEIEGILQRRNEYSIGQGTLTSNLSVEAGYGSKRTFLSVKRVLADRVLPDISPHTPECLPYHLPRGLNSQW